MKYLTKLEQFNRLSLVEKVELKRVTEKFSFRANDYYLSLINWNDPQDPIRKLIIPDLRELDQWGQLDSSDEESHRIMSGLEHKYNSTAVLLVSNVCEGICRYCFRKRVFISSRDDHIEDLVAALRYIGDHKEITNVLLTGGDPLVLKPSNLENLIRLLRQIEHVKIIRIGTRVPAFNPHRIVNESALLEIIERYSSDDRRIYVIAHFIHPRELSGPAVRAMSMLQKAGAVTANQMPLIRGINDRADILADLLSCLSCIGVAPYYVFQCRPAVGNKAYTVPIEEGYEIVEQAKSLVSGLAKRVRFVMSHATGKIEILAKSNGFVYFKYHRAAEDTDSGRLLVVRSNPKACWLDDYTEIDTIWP